MSINMEALFVGILRTHIGHDIFFSSRKLVIVICKHESINHHVEIHLLKTTVMSPCSHSVTKSVSTKSSETREKALLQLHGLLFEVTLKYLRLRHITHTSRW